MIEKILLTGPFGQVGTELLPELQKKYGKKNVIALGHHKIPEHFEGILEKGDIGKAEQIESIVKKHSITQIYHLAALLSVTGETYPNLAWDVNLLALKTILDIAVSCSVKKVFWASSMAVFGPTTPKINTPQHTIIEPTTMYGVTKYSGELLCQYYSKKYNLDIRSLRYPGIISWKELPGGGTTDYAVGIFYDAIKTGKYTCFVNEKTTLPMMYIDDAIKATLEIMEAQPQRITIRTSYNLAAISFSVEELANAIKKYIPELEVTYNPDHRQTIADSWADSIDDSVARKDWGWQHHYDLEKLVQVMYTNLKQKLA